MEIPLFNFVCFDNKKVVHITLEMISLRKQAFSSLTPENEGLTRFRIPRKILRQILD